jgi:hypothetical protein
MTNKPQVIFAAVLFFLISTSFQNCSPPAISVTEVASQAIVVENQKTELVNETHVKSFEIAPNDILFVIDDSSSMNSILSKIKSGIASLQNVTFPQSTKMAVTYMSPDRYASDNSITFGSPWFGLALGTPGHLQLVNSQTIQTFLEIPKSETDLSNRSFPLSGCTQNWFSPNETNSRNESCLSSAMQTPLYSTGVEAGAVSLFQMIELFSQKQSRLFREKANVNIIFISDTHEPGANYWGKTGAPASPYTLDQMKSAIIANSSDLSSIKFSGVLPVPSIGSMFLEGLRVLGEIPATEADSQVSGELLYDFAYLPFIKGTNGVITHPVSEDWSQLTEELMKDSIKPGAVIVEVQDSIYELQSVLVNDQPLELTTVTVSLDRKSFSFTYTSESSIELKIKVAYTKKALN